MFGKLEIQYPRYVIPKSKCCSLPPLLDIANSTRFDQTVEDCLLLAYCAMDRSIVDFP